MAFFSAIAAAAGAVFTAATTTAIGKILTGVAINALASALFAPSAPGRVSNPILDKGQLGIVARSFIVGTYATKGSIVYRNSYGTGSDDPTEKFVVVYALSDLPVRGLSRMWINGQECSLQNGTPGPRGWVIPEFNYDDKAKAYYNFYDGTQTVANPELVNNVSSDERPWTSAHVGRGIAYAILTLDHDPRVWTTGRPDVLFEVQGYRFRDPSTGAMGTGDQTPAAQMHGILSGIEYAGEWFYGPQKPAVLPTANWAKAVEDCRRKVPGADQWTTAERNRAFRDGTVPSRYASGMEISVDRPVSEVCQDLATACNGRFVEVAGAWKFQVGDPPPVSAANFTFSDDDISTLDAQTFSPFLPLAETVNHFTGTYPDPEQQYNMQEAPALRVAAYEQEDGDRRLTSNVQFNAVTAKEQVQRLMKSALAEARRARRHTITLGSKFFGVEPGDYGAWDSSRNGYIKKLFRVDGIRDEPNGSVTLDLTEVDPSDYDFDGPDFQVVSSGSIVKPAEPTYVVPNWSVQGVEVNDGSGARRVAAEFTWNAGKRGEAVEYQIYAGSGTNLVTDGRFDSYDLGRGRTGDGIAPNGSYEARVRRIKKRGRTPWSQRKAFTAPDVRLSEKDLQEKIQKDLAAAEKAADELDAIAEEKGTRLLDYLAQIEAGTVDETAVYEYIDEQTQAAKAGAQAYTDKQTVSLADDLGSIAATISTLEAAFIPNLGFEDVKGRDAGEPTGWRLVTAVGGELVVRHHTDKLAPETKGKYSFGSQTSDAGPWWYLSKVFRFTRGQNIRVLAQGWVSTAGTPNASPDGGFVGEDDFFIHFIQRDENGDILDESTTISGVYTTFQNEGVLRGGWHKRDSSRTGVNRVAYIEVRLVAADGNATNVGNKQVYGSFSGNAAVLFDDIEMESDNGTLIEVDPHDLTRAVSTSARLQNIEHLDVTADDAFGRFFTRLGVQAGGNNAGVIADGMAYASKQGAKSKYVLTTTAGSAQSTFRLLAADNLDGNPISQIAFGADYYVFKGGLALFDGGGLQSAGFSSGRAGDGFRINTNGAEFGTLALRENSITFGNSADTENGFDLVSVSGDGSATSHFQAQYLNCLLSPPKGNIPYDLYFFVTAVGDGMEMNVSLDGNANCIALRRHLTPIAEISGSDAQQGTIIGKYADLTGDHRIRLWVRKGSGSSPSISRASMILLGIAR
ncbi:phage tail protein [uncultured Jannaschia sp.]|uniref:phage tail protein n=1 Tax=uncultured Jannaschia sp. TaxID=293347 RepID=UPI00261DB3AB|nr:phage tail protein [uncultured Jannaschia sp.]